MVITIVSGKTGREQNPLHLEKFMQLFDNLETFRVPFWRPLDFERGPKIDQFVKKLKEMRKTRSNKRVGKNIICRLIVDAKMGCPKW